MSGQVTGLRPVITDRALPEGNRAMVRLLSSGEGQVFVSRPALNEDPEGVVLELLILLNEAHA